MNYFVSKKTNLPFKMTLVCLTICIIGYFVIVFYPTPKKVIKSYLANELKNDINTSEFEDFKTSLLSIGITKLNPKLNKQLRLTSTLTQDTSLIIVENKANPEYLVTFQFNEYFQDNSLKQVYSGSLQFILKKTNLFNWNLIVTKIKPIKPVIET